MNTIAELLSANNFIKTLVDSLPCGLLVVDRQGRVQIVNNVLENVFKVNNKNALGKGTGNVLGCLCANEHPKGCGFGECCKDCEVRKLTFNSLSTNRKKRTRAHLQLIRDGLVRDLDILISSFPFTLNNELFGILIIENLGTLRAFVPDDTPEGFRGIVGCSDSMRDLFNTIRQIARTAAPVMIQGESGTGKELVALAVHKESSRAHKNFIPVNCGALPEGLLESELFGHVKGAFTGAHRSRKGRFELADEGTIFLDEVGELSPTTQVKLLRVLQDGNFEAVGSEHTLRVNVRVISATNKNLAKEIAAGRFREDLYYRLCAMPILILPLRDRKEDIPLLVEHFLSQFSENAWGKKIAFTDAALSILVSHNWPGNVRELINTINFTLAKCQGKKIKPEHLPPTLQFNTSILYTSPHREPKLHRIDVARALKKAGGNKCRAAEILGVSRSTLYRFFAKQEVSSKDL